MRLAGAKLGAHPHGGLHAFVPAAQQLLLFLIQLNGYLTHIYFIEIGPLKESINTMNPTHHVATLFFKVNVFLLHFINSLKIIEKYLN